MVRSTRPGRLDRTTSVGRWFHGRVGVCRVSLLILVGLGLTLVIVVGQRLYSRPLDISGTYRFPTWLDAIKRRDDVAYPFHAALGTLLNKLGGDPDAAALQWLKAAT